MNLNRILSVLTGGAVLLSACLTAAPVANAAVVVTPPAHCRTVVHGTLDNRHVSHAAHVVKPRAAAVAKKPTVTHVKAAVRRPVTRSHRVAHRGHHRSGGVGGHVRTSGGAAVAGATVSIARSGHARSGANRHVHIGHSTITDSSGHFVMRDIRAGSHRVVASKAGVGKGGKSVHVRGGALRSGVEIKLGGSSHKHKKHHKHK